MIQLKSKQCPKSQWESAIVDIFKSTVGHFRAKKKASKVHFLLVQIKDYEKRYLIDDRNFCLRFNVFIFCFVNQPTLTVKDLLSHLKLINIVSEKSLTC